MPIANYCIEQCREGCDKKGAKSGTIEDKSKWVSGA
jgi:hypothetical protein